MLLISSGLLSFLVLVRGTAREGHIRSEKAIWPDDTQCQASQLACGEHIHAICSEERVKRVSDARSQRLDEFRQGQQKQQVLLQQHQQQLKAEAEAAGDTHTQRQAARLQAEEEERNLVIIIKADVQVCPSLYHKLRGSKGMHAEQDSMKGSMAAASLTHNLTFCLLGLISRLLGCHKLPTKHCCLPMLLQQNCELS